MHAERTLTGDVIAALRTRPDREALVVVHPDGRDERVSAAELDRDARAVAAELQARRATGRQVLVAMSPGRDLVVALLACLYAGSVAVPAPLPGVSRAAGERTTAIVKDCAACLVLTRAESAAEISRLLAAAGRHDVPCLVVDAVATRRDPGEWTPPRLSGGDLALIQYTSGTTALPRGVRITQANLCAAMDAVRTVFDTGPQSRIGGWLPYYHDLGLIGQLLHPLWLGATAVLMPPELYLADPAAWLHAIGRYGVTTAAAPDSAYARCAAEVTDDQLASLDLSRWHTAVNAAETVQATTLAAFRRRFAAAGLPEGAQRPAYGLAEATLLVAAGREPGGWQAAGRELGGRQLGSRGAEGTVFSADRLQLGRGLLRPAEVAADGRAVVASGMPAPGMELVVVDPRTGAELPDGAVGEILVGGPSVAPGYWGRPLETGEVFGRRGSSGSGNSGGSGLLATGDLGALLDGQLHVLGRQRELLKVDGRSLHPQEIERQLLDCGAMLASAVVFAVGGGSEQLIVVQEVRGTVRSHGGHAELVAKVRRCLAEEFGAVADGVVLVRPGTVRRTTSGKVRRSVLRENFLRGELRALHAECTEQLRCDIPEFIATA
ncbi:AMP-binding protein [Streptacidiphilus fuscans]|uniref:AMP-binding protein n=1 Tax=Streptacidiphilus fuscans TaxID=2789292 RepID=A0A931B7P5_9ACTN|nr:AMP-binding protein [Streptacidiphilus fuscans]MBF9068430.1 AMP-binding protein [Streptacidiphilus fuscans]